MAQSLNPKFPKFPKLVGAPKTFGNFRFPCVFFWDFQQKSKKAHGNFWIFNRNPKKTWKLLDFQQKSKKDMEILDFQQKSKKAHGNFWIFSRNPKKTWKLLDFQQKSKKAHGNSWIFNRNPKKTWKFLDFQQKSKKHMEIQNFQKFSVRPIVLKILDFLEILDFLKFGMWSRQNPLYSISFY